MYTAFKNYEELFRYPFREIIRVWSMTWPLFVKINWNFFRATRLWKGREKWKFALNDAFKIVHALSQCLAFIDRSPFDAILAVGRGKERIYIEEIKNRAPYIDPCIGSPSRESRTPATVSTVGCFVAGCEKNRVIGKSDRLRTGNKWRPIGGRSSLIRIAPRAFLRLCSLWMEGYLLRVFLLAPPISRFLPLLLSRSATFFLHDDRILISFFLNTRLDARTEDVSVSHTKFY